MTGTRIIGDVPAGTRRLVFCFHHAGGSAYSYNGCLPHLPADLALMRVQLPGRAGPAEAVPASVEALLPGVMEAFLDCLPAAARGLPYAFYGHSLGALVAFELARLLRAGGHAMPVGLVVSGRRAPQCPLAGRALCAMTDDELMTALPELGGLPPILIENPKLLRRLLPTIRADLTVSDMYRYEPEAPLACPILAFKGRSDPILSARELAAWGGQTLASFAWREVEGTHFLDEAGTAALREDTLRALDDWTREECHAEPTAIA